MRSSFNLLWIFVLVCCKNADHNQSAEKTRHNKEFAKSTITVKGLDLEPRLKLIDSMQILYYDNPDGDSLRFSRYYRFLSSKDSVIINTVLTNLDQPYEQKNDVKKCRSEGKIYLYSRREPVKTIYFSTRCDTCCYLYFIKNGNFIYFPILSETSNALLENKANSKKP